jgi:C-terminal processing protease CtpA/Prc
LNGTDAIIFDLRDNMGGYPGMVEEIAAPLFDHPAPWYNPKEPSGAASSIHSPVPGSRLANKAAYILTSSRTFSGAEQFAYNLKMLKRATLVGETTGGGAHVGVFHRLDDHFGIGIPETPITNPYGGPDWEGTGVHPDVIVPAKDALATAEELARKSLRK